MISDNMQTRTVQQSRFTARGSADNPRIEGYFALFNSIYHVFDGCTESVAPGAFTDSLNGDVRALINHDSTFVLGRTKAGTLRLKQDSTGLWASIDINKKDTAAMNVYARVQRGDVSQASFGFQILEEEHEERPDGTHHFTIKKVRLFEISAVTFPAYEDTAIAARKRDISNIDWQMSSRTWKAAALKRLRAIASK